MAINFPSSPSINDVHTENSLSWRYNGNAWLTIATSNIESVVATGSTEPRSLSDRFADTVNVKDFGAVGDGVTDDTAAIQAALNAGRAVMLTKSSYSVDDIIIPDNTSVMVNGATFIPRTSGTSFLVNIGSNVTIDNITIAAPTAILKRGVTADNKSNINIGELTVTSVDQFGTSGLNQAVRFTGCSGVNIDKVTTTNFDYPITYDGCNRLCIKSHYISSYVRGVYITDCVDTKLGASKLETASPNASLTSGHNGALIDATATGLTNNVTLEDWHIRDAGEHGIRIGGQFTCRNIKLVRTIVRDAGASGIKALGASGQFHTDLTIDSPVIVDCGVASNNAAGVMLQRVIFAQVMCPKIHVLSNATSVYYGIRLTAVENVLIQDPQINNTASHGISIDPQLGSNDHITISGGRIKNCTGSGLDIDITNITIRKLVVSGSPMFDGNNIGISVGSGGAITRMSLTGEFHDSVTASTSIATNDPLVAFKGEFTSSPAANGSTWQDTSAGEFKVRKAGAWTTL